MLLPSLIKYEIMSYQISCISIGANLLEFHNKREEAWVDLQIKHRGNVVILHLRLTSFDEVIMVEFNVSFILVDRNL